MINFSKKIITFDKMLFSRSSLVVVAITSVFLGQPSFYFFFTIFVILCLFRPIYGFSLLFFSGILKNAPFFSLPYFDLTIYSLGLLLFYFFKRRKEFLNVDYFREINLILFGMLCVAFFSILTSPAPWGYLMRSGLHFIVLYIPLMLILVNSSEKIFPTRKVLETFGNALMLCGLLWVGLGLHNEVFSISLFQKRDPSHFVAHISAFGEDYVAFAFFPALILITILCDILFRKRQLWATGILCCVIPIIFNAPARGLLLGLFVSLLILLIGGVVYGKIKLKHILLGITIVALPIAGYLLLFLDERRSLLLNRMLNFSPSSETVQYRFNSIKLGFHYWMKKPFFGTGMDSVAFLGEHSGLYSHNFILEVIFEFGIIGSLPFLIFLILVCMGIWHIYKIGYSTENKQLVWLSGLGIIFVVLVQSSGTIGNNRHFWLISALIILIWSRNQLKMSSQ